MNMKYVIINPTVRGWARNVLSTSGMVLDVSPLWNPADIRRHAAMRFASINAIELRQPRIGDACHD